MKHNLIAEKTRPEDVINSPTMVKCGALVDHKNQKYAKYIIFEELDQHDQVKSDGVKQLSDAQKRSIRREIQNLHSYVKISHGDIAARNMFLDQEGVPHFIDYDCSHKLKSTNSEYRIRDLVDLEEMLSN